MLETSNIRNRGFIVSQKKFHYSDVAPCRTDGSYATKLHTRIIVGRRKGCTSRDDDELEPEVEPTEYFQIGSDRSARNCPRPVKNRQNRGKLVLIGRTDRLKNEQ